MRLSSACWWRSKKVQITSVVTTILLAVVIDKLTKLDLLGWLWKKCGALWSTMISPIRIPALVLIAIGLILFWVTVLAYLNRKTSPATKLKEDIWSNSVLGTWPEKPEKLDANRLLSMAELPQRVTLRLMGYQNDNPLLAYQYGLCGADYEPGTFTLEEITPGSHFLQRKEDINTWLSRVVNEELNLIRPHHPDLIGNKSGKEVAQHVRSLLLCGVEGNLPSMGHSTWYQEYSDIVLRLIATVLTGDPDFEFISYPNLTFESNDLMKEVIRRLTDAHQPGLEDWLHLSIAAGLVGVDEKSIHSATSEIDTQTAISLSGQGIKQEERASSIADQLWAAAKTRTRVDASMTFFHQLTSSSWRRFRLISFPNDYIETLFLLTFYSELLKEYSKLEIDFVPRSIRYGNDFCYADWLELSKSTVFGDMFSGIARSPNFRVHSFGPKLSTVNLRKLDPRVMSIMTAADLADVRGARNYEMMQGMNKEAYFSFMVCREISESVTGLRSNDMPLVFLRQRAREKSFEGFRERHSNRIDGRMICPTAVLDHKAKWEGGHLASFPLWTGERKDHYAVTERFYSQNAPYFHQRYGDFLETNVRGNLGALHGRVLVLGCGSGKEVRYLAARGCNVEGIDFSDEAIILARNLYPQLWNQFHVEDMYNVQSYGLGDYDAIVANAVFVHLLERSDLQSMMDAIFDRLATGGKCYVRVLEKEGISEEYDNQLFDRPRWFVYYSLNDLVGAAEQARMAVISKERIAHAQYQGVFWVSILAAKIQTAQDKPNSRE